MEVIKITRTSELIDVEPKKLITLSEATKELGLGSITALKNKLYWWGITVYERNEPLVYHGRLLISRDDVVKIKDKLNSN